MTTDQSPVLGHRRGAQWHRVSYGVHRPVDGCDLDAWALVLPPGGRFTHLTAARELGWRLPLLPDGLPVVAAAHPWVKTPERSGLLVRRTVSVGTPSLHYGHPLDAPVDILLNLARDLALLDLVPVLDGVLHSGDCTLDEVRQAARFRRRGAPRLREAIALCDGRSESWWESMLRRLHEVGGFPVEPQHVVRDALGEVVGRLDLLLVGSRHAPEYDGAHHLPVEQQRADHDRIRRLRAVGYERQGWTSDEVLHRPSVVLADAERATGRSAWPDAGAVWQQLLRESCHTPEGRARLHKRLVRSTTEK
jgi:very-short-patch-repair endonuclease